MAASKELLRYAKESRAFASMLELRCKSQIFPKGSGNGEEGAWMTWEEHALF